MKIRTLLLAALIYNGTVASHEMPIAGWQDNFITRLKAQALLQALNATLLSNPSATMTLQNCCVDHKMAGESRIRALRDLAIRKPADAATRELLQIGDDEPVGYRRVQLTCGDHILSEADNWYVKSRITPEMNQVLDRSDTPFGLAVKALNFNRKTFSSRLLWSPLPVGWEMEMPAIHTTKAPLAIPDQVLQHRALLSREGDASDRLS